MTVSANTAQVAIVRARDYGPGTLRRALENCLGLIDGLDTVVKPGAKVFVKINHLSPPSPAERGIVTHPAFTASFLELLKETGAEITVGDDVEAEGEDGFALSGYREMCNRLSVRLVNLREAGFIKRALDGALLKEAYISRLALEADVVINLPKLKTHSLTVLTGAVKNMYGVIPVGLRRRFHGDYLAVDDFCRMLVDLYSMARPRLNVMDGVVAMEGEGPGSGSLRNTGVVLASRDGVALDAVAAAIIKLDPAAVLTTRYAADRGLGVADLSRIQVLGETIASVTIPDFKPPAAISRIAVSRAPRFLGRFAVAQISPRPYVSRADCTGCGECAKACPACAMTISGKKAEINHAVCLRCMCCHEVCRQGAIVPRRPFLGNAVYSTVQAVRKLTAGKHPS